MPVQTVQTQIYTVQKPLHFLKACSTCGMITAIFHVSDVLSCIIIIPILGMQSFTKVLDKVSSLNRTDLTSSCSLKSSLACIISLTEFLFQNDIIPNVLALCCIGGYMRIFSLKIYCFCSS